MECGGRFQFCQWRLCNDCQFFDVYTECSAKNTFLYYFHFSNDIYVLFWCRNGEGNCQHVKKPREGCNKVVGMFYRLGIIPQECSKICLGDNPGYN